MGQGHSKDKRETAVVVPSFGAKKDPPEEVTRQTKRTSSAKQPEKRKSEPTKGSETATARKEEKPKLEKTVSSSTASSAAVKEVKKEPVAKSIPKKTIIEKVPKHDKLVVAAIDFGTFGSGFALCTRDLYHSDPGKIYVETWNSGTTVTYKTPTCVLLTPDKTIVSFGYDAEQDYVNLDAEKQKTHYLFRQFKMTLFEVKGLSELTKLKDIKGKELPAIDVFSSVIGYIRDKLQCYLEKKDSNTDFTFSDVYWVITVPAIWDLRAKHFMRKAAKQAGIDDNQLSLALEPEAASLYCRKVPVEISTTIDGGKQIATLGAGAKYLVLDLGGGTIDITAHEVSPDGGLRELQQACGGYWGGTRVNEAFNSKILKRLLGGDVIFEVKDKHSGDWLDLCNEFESKKCNFKGKDSTKKVTVRLPVTLINAYRELTECDVSEALESNSSLSDDLTFKRDKLSISSSLFESLFEESIDNVLKYVENLLKEEGMDDVSTLLAVGGFAESPMMVNALKENFPDKKVVVPSNPSLAVLKGAVIYGFEPKVIGSRVCRYTYGIAKQRIFKPGVDPEHKKSAYHTKEGKHWCDGVFDKHVETGQIVKVGEFQEPKEYFRVKNDQQYALLDFYASKDKDTKYIDDPGCECIGALIIDLTPMGAKDDGKILVRLGNGGTEMQVEAIEASSGKVFKTVCDFLP